MKKILSLILVLVMALTLVACGGSSDKDEAKEPETIRIGVVAPRTGESSLWGDVLYHTIELLATQTNEAGGLLGKQIEIMSYDNRGDAVETTNVVRKAILNDGVVALIGTDSSTTTIAMVEVASEYGIPVLTHIATNSKVTRTDEGEVRPYAFRSCMSDPQSGSILGQYAVKDAGYKKIAIIYEIGSDFSVGVTEEFSKNVEASGGEIVCKEAYNTGDVDFRAILTRIKNAGDFDALYIAAGYYKEIGLIANQARELGIEQPFLSTEGAMSGDIFNIAPDSVEGTIFPLPVDATAEGVDDLLNAFIEMWDYDPSLNVAADCYLAYDVWQILSQAIEKAGVVDSEKIRDELEATTEIQGLTSPITFDPETHDVFREVPIYKIVNGDYERLGMFMLENTNK